MLGLPLVLSALSVSRPSAQNSQPRECDAKTLQSCYDTYIANFNLTTDPFPTFFDYLLNLSTILRKPKAEGFKNVCQWHHSLEKCLGSGNIETCENGPAIKYGLGISDTDALGYETYFHEFQYYCSNGYETFYKNSDCIVGVLQKYPEESRACINNYLEQLKNGFSCKAITDVHKCFNKIYAHCGQDMAKMVCEAGNIALEAVTNLCNNVLVQC
ncbi:hypothetical protein L596_021767 [Steinernema carpocapsae]|uniref:DUF19 domain-containing protein n=1 Tax=Steinernema carpocapsae TaxID=34508 RepID=A0A4U5MJR8_STECR|nr:hypothetical protein L596_021767 [Steinernema carpocapsae]